MLKRINSLKIHTLKYRANDNVTQGKVKNQQYDVNTRVGTKSNCYRELYEDAHYLFARNKYRREFVSLYPKNSVMISTDDMATVKVGPPAISRYHQIKQMFLEEDQPNYPDHDFPVPGYLLNVSGYMTLEQKVSMFVFLSIFHFAFYVYLHWLIRLY